MSVNPIPLYLETLRKNVDPQIDAINIDELIPEGMIVSDFAEEVFDQGYQTKESGYINVSGILAKGNSRFGDTWGYHSGDHKFVFGAIKALKGTIQVEFDEDSMDRVVGNQSQLIADAIMQQQKMEARHLYTRMNRMAFSLAVGDPEFDPEWISPLAPSTVGSVANPADANTVPGTAEVIPDTIIWSGPAQTLNNTTRFLNILESAWAALIDPHTEFSLEFNDRYLAVPPTFYAILKSVNDLLTATQRNPLTYLQDFEAKGWKIRKALAVDPSYLTAGVAGAATRCDFVVYNAPGENFVRILTPPPEGFGWTEWERARITDNGQTKFTFEKHKKFEWAMLARAHNIEVTGVAARWRKPVFWGTTIPHS